MAVGTGVVILDKDGGKVVELNASGDLPVFISNISKSPVVLHRHGTAGTDYFLNANDTTSPNVTSGINLSAWGSAKIDCLVSGDIPTWDLVPLMSSPDNSNYVSGDTRTVIGNQTFTMEVAGCDDFYVLCRNKTGTNPGIKVYVQGYNI